MTIFLFVLAATIVEAVGDAVIRIALHHESTNARVAYFLLGTALLAAYGTTVNLAPVEFATVTGMYVATLFVVFQITNAIFFHTAPTPAIWLGGTLIVAGGVVVSTWR